MIYAIEILNGNFVKIGYSGSDNVLYRIAELQTGNPFEIKPMFCTYGTLSQEKSVHASLNVAFGRIRIPIPPNEWYPGKVHFFVSFLEHLRLGPDMGIAFAEKYNPAVKQPSTRPGKGVFSTNFRWPT